MKWIKITAEVGTNIVDDALIDVDKITLIYKLKFVPGMYCIHFGNNTSGIQVKDSEMEKIFAIIGTRL